MINRAYRIFAVFLAGLFLTIGVAWFLPGIIEQKSDIIADDSEDDSDRDHDTEDSTDGGDQPTTGPVPDPPESFPDGNVSTEPPQGEVPPTDPPTSESEPVVDIASYIRAKVNGLQLRTGPGTNHTSLGSINKGDMVTLIAKEGNWYRTKYKNKTAYISAGQEYTELYEMQKHSLAAVEAIIGQGASLLGFPYVYGAIRYHDGSGKKLHNFDATQYDCSSLIQYIFYRGAAINLQMTTRTQVTQGIFVPRSKIMRGDLIFFTNAQRYNKTGVERVGHVALYLGDNYILHTASDYAVIEQISAQRWKYYIETRRFL